MACTVIAPCNAYWFSFCTRHEITIGIYRLMFIMHEVDDGSITWKELMRDTVHKPSLNKAFPNAWSAQQRFWLSACLLCAMNHSLWGSQFNFTQCEFKEALKARGHCNKSTCYLLVNLPEVLSDPHLLLALFFSICSLWCTCHSSSSFLAFSFHSASAALDAESCQGVKRERCQRGKERMAQWREQSKKC